MKGQSAHLVTRCTAAEDVPIRLTQANSNPLPSDSVVVQDQSVLPTEIRPDNVIGAGCFGSAHCRTLPLSDRLYSVTVRPVCTNRSELFAASASTFLPACSTIFFELPWTTETVEPLEKYTAPSGA